MDIIPEDQTTQPISDDQELAKALAGVMPDMPEPIIPQPAAQPESAMQFEETPAPSLPPLAFTTPVVPEPVVIAPLSVAPASDTNDLESIKKDALDQLRPLIGKVDLPAEEKFDTYLMLIRSTDDATLIAPAHAAAQAITDEKRRAEALLDVIKEIDYLSRNKQIAA